MTLARVFVPFAFAYFFSHLFRVVNAVIAPNLVEDLGLDAAELGLLTSVYFLAFAAAQMPLGIALDRFGPRRTEAALTLAAVAGAALFAAAESVAALVFGRALIGLGVSAGLMGALKAFRIWFPAPRLPLVNGCHMAIGGLGAIAATQPVEMALDAVHWRTLFIVMGGFTLAAAAILFAVVPEREGAHQDRGGLREQAAGTLHVFASPAFWRVVPVVVATHAANFAILTLWSGPWLRDVAGLDRAGVAQHLLALTTALTAGFLIQGALAERLQRFGVPVLTVMLAGMVAFMGAQALIVVGWTGALMSTWIVFGLFGSVGILSYADLPQRFAVELSGRVVTSINLLVFAFAFVFQWGLGIVIGLWPTAPGGGYAAEAYAWSFGFLLAIEAAAFAWYFVFRGGQTAGLRPAGSANIEPPPRRPPPSGGGRERSP